jgi:hypothetical protein
MDERIEYSLGAVSKQSAKTRRRTRTESSVELLRLYAEADALVRGRTCVCSDAEAPEAAACCHFGNIGREPYVTALEMVEVTRALAARGGVPRRALPLAETLRTCPLLSSAGRCTIYESRPLGCRTFFCQALPGAEGARVRRALIDVAHRLADVSARAFPRGEGSRALTRALASLATLPSRRSASPIP